QTPQWLRSLVLDIGEAGLDVINVLPAQALSAVIGRASSGFLGGESGAPLATGLVNGDQSVDGPGPLVHPRDDVGVLHLWVGISSQNHPRLVDRSRLCDMLSTSLCPSLVLAAIHLSKVAGWRQRDPCLVTGILARSRRRC